MAFDDALPPQLYKALLHEVQAIEPRLTELDSASGWWWQKSETPRFLIEAAVAQLGKLAQQSCADRWDDVIGGEWWIQRRGASNSTINFHFDKDVGLKMLHQRNEYPLVSTGAWFVLPGISQ